MSSIFSFLQPQPVAQPSATPAAAPVPAAPAFGLGAVLAQMLAALQPYLPAAVPGLPGPNVIIVSLNDAPVGIGNFIGTDRRGPLAQTEVKGGRLDAVVRFQLWGANADAVNADMLGLQGRLLAARDDLWSAGFLRFSSETSSSAQVEQPAGTWYRTADYHVLYEYKFDVSDAAQSLIARIPVHADQEVVNSPDRETTVVTDEMARWDNLGAPTLGLHGRASVGLIEALVFLPGATPSGTVTLLRTFDGALTPPINHPTVAAFLAAVTDPASPQRNARVVFPNFADFLAQFSQTGTPQPLGDWDLDGSLDEYRSYMLSFGTPVSLPAPVDRLEVRYGNGNESFDQVAVAYLRAR